MNKTIHKIFTTALLVACTAISMPAMAESPATLASEAGAVDVMHAVEVKAENGHLVVKNAEGCVLEVFSITGEMKMAQKVDSPAASYDLSNLPKGIYLVKVGKTTFKVYLK